MIPRYALVLLVGMLGTSGLVHAQEATERFIPIGQSPGLSGRYTMIGRIGDVDRQARTLEVAADGETYSIAVTESTRIWIDRSHLSLPSLTKAFADCQLGLEVEVKWEGDQRTVADWIKVRAAEH